jgi:hypothetical protein
MIETEGLLSKNSLEGVLAISGRRSRDERWRLDGGGRKRVGLPELGGSTIGDGEELAGVACPGSTGHGSMNGWYQEKAEMKEITTMPLARPRKARCSTGHGR